MGAVKGEQVMLHAARCAAELFWEEFKRRWFGRKREMVKHRSFSQHLAISWMMAKSGWVIARSAKENR